MTMGGLFFLFGGAMNAGELRRCCVVGGGGGAQGGEALHRSTCMHLHASRGVGQTCRGSHAGLTTDCHPQPPPAAAQNLGMLIVGRISLGFGIGEPSSHQLAQTSGAATAGRRCRMDAKPVQGGASELLVPCCAPAGAANQSVPLYLSEMAPHHARGAMNIM